MRAIFTNVEEEYDALLHLFTLGFDWSWRKRMLSKVRYHRDVRILDLDCGTGLVTFQLCRSMKPEGILVGLDPSTSMLRIALRKKHRVRHYCMLDFVRATAEFMPFRAEVFEYETIGLALRNFANKSGAFAEAHRTLTESGWLLSVDFVRPKKVMIRTLYRFHIFHVLPALGQLVSASWHRTLEYLANSIERSDEPAAVCTLLSRSGFRRTLTDEITLGVVALVGGQK